LLRKIKQIILSLNKNASSEREFAFACIFEKKKNNTINCAELNESIYLIIKIITKTKQKYNEKTSLFQHLLYTHTK